MNFEKITSLMGGTLSSEEYRGNFAHIRFTIAALEQSPGFRTSSELRARVLLLKAVLSMLSGNFSESISALSALNDDAADLGERWAFRIKSYERLCAYLQLVPPLLRFQSQYGSSAGTIREAELRESIAQLSAWHSEVEDLDQFEAALPTYLYQSNLYLWAVQGQHDQYANQPLAAKGAEILSQLDTTFLHRLKESATELHLSQTAASLGRIEYECEVARGSESSDTLFNQLYNHHEDNIDIVGMALSHISKADNILSPPFTSPIALNLVVQGGLNGWANEKWDNEEPKFSLRYNMEAQSHYSKALAMVDTTSAPRCRAAILLRMGCISHMEGIVARQQNRISASKRLFEAADTQLQEAKRWFELDESNCQLVECHQILLDISRDRLSGINTRASAIGEWGKTARHETLSQFLGLLMMRFGRRQYLDGLDANRGLLCLSCAGSCFRALGDDVFVLQALMAEADTQYHTGNGGLARIRIDEAREQLQVSLDHMRDLAFRHPSRASALRGILLNMLLGFHPVASKIYALSVNPRDCEKWSEYYRTAMADIKAHGYFQKIMALPSRPAGSSDSNQPPIMLNMTAIFQEQREGESLARNYHEKSNMAYSELEKGNIDGYEAHLQEFLDDSSSSGAPQDLVATFRLLTLSSLGDFEQAKTELPRAVPRLFGQEENLTERCMRLLHMEGQVIDHSIQIDSNQALRAISLCFLCRDWDRGSYLLETISQNVPGYLDLDEMRDHSTDWMLATWVGAIYEHNGQYDTAFEWYLWANEVMETQREGTSDDEARRGSQSSIHGGELFAGLIRVCLRYASLSTTNPQPKAPIDWGLPAPNWTGQALVFLERTFARTLLEFLIGRSKTDPEIIEAWAASTYINRQITDLTLLLPNKGEDEGKKSRVEIELDRLRAESEKRPMPDAQISQVTRSLLSATRFQIDPESICRVIPEDAVVVEMNLSRGGLILFCLTTAGVVSIHQSERTILDLRRQVLRYVKRLENDQCSRDELSSLIMGISREIIHPFEEVIWQKDHVIFVPTQEFNFFPFSALTFNDKPLFLEKAVSQVPSLATLEQIVKRPHPGMLPELSTIVNTHEPDASGPKHAGEPVPMVGVGAAVVSHIFSVPPTDARYLEEAGFKNIFENSEIVYIGTHGAKHELSPWQSCINLKDEFRVMEVAKFSSKASLIIFGACMSGLGRVTVGNDVLGFSHAVLQSGAGAYMGALWKVDVSITMMLIVVFSRKVAQRTQRTTLAKCWQEAQKTLYNLTTDAAVSMLQGILDEWETAKQKWHLEHLAKGGIRLLKRLMEDLETVDFKHPYYWAPFTLVGHAGRSLDPTISTLCRAMTEQLQGDSIRLNSLHEASLSPIAGIK
ncbi:hypothetical protein KXW40_007984 [Aspergillus fumigatus]|nr:hypothetical protein KXW40_007984 [Aspergillus fumigatus]